MMPHNIKDFLKKIKDFLTPEEGEKLSLIDVIVKAIKQALGIESEHTFLDFLKHIFITLFDPTEYKNEIMDYIDEKLVIDMVNFTFIYYSYKMLIDNIKQLDAAPVIHFPDLHLGGQTITGLEMDLNFLQPYIGYIRGTLAVFLYSAFILAMYKNLPRLIEGFSFVPLSKDMIAPVPDNDTFYGYKNGVKTK